MDKGTELGSMVCLTNGLFVGYFVCHVYYI